MSKVLKKSTWYENWLNYTESIFSHINIEIKKKSSRLLTYLTRNGRGHSHTVRMIEQCWNFSRDETGMSWNLTTQPISKCNLRRLLLANIVQGTKCPWIKILKELHISLNLKNGNNVNLTIIIFSQDFKSIENEYLN